MIVSPAFFHGSKTVSVSSLARVQGRRGRDWGRGTGEGEREKGDSPNSVCTCFDRVERKLSIRVNVSKVNVSKVSE